MIINFLTAVVLAMLWCINWFPYPAKLAVGKGIGLLIYKTAGRRLHIARVNLALCFDDMTDLQRERLAKESFINLGAGIVEAAMAWWDKPSKAHAMTEFIGREVLEQALQTGKGVLLIGAHYSTLDMSGVLISKHFRINVIYRLQNNAVLNRVMMRGRARSLLDSIPHTSMRKAVKKLKAGEIVWYSPDQDMGIDHSVYAPFFGQTAATVTATAKLVKLSGAEVVIISTYRKADDSGYVVELMAGPEDYPGDDHVDNAAKINQLLERGIMRAPSQYAWYHRRFKTQPGLEKGALYQRDD